MELLLQKKDKLQKQALLNPKRAVKFESEIDELQQKARDIFEKYEI